MNNNVAVLFPSCNPQRAETATVRWLNQGYDVYLYLEVEMGRVKGADCFWGNYPGYNAAVNMLCKYAVDGQYGAYVFAADDMDPDPYKTGNEIVEDCYEDYGNLWLMQPSGDPFQKPDICGSPWFSSELVERMYGGRFPYPAWYNRWFGDDELFIVANMLGIHHRRDDLTQYHHHWWRPDAVVQQTKYQELNQRVWYPRDEVIFKKRFENNFPEHELML